MLTLFTIPKPFTDPHISVIQKNAILSWKKAIPDGEVFLVGDDPGVSEAANELQVKHLPEVELNEFNTPLLNSAFDLVRQKANFDKMVFLNCDIMLLDDFAPALERLPEDGFLAVGRRWDLDVEEPIDFRNENWRMDIRKQVMKNGRLHSAAGIDYFIFNKNSFTDLPELAVGRVGWDNWMVYTAKQQGMKVIDLSRAVTAVHQNHGYPAKNKGAERKTNPEAAKNFSFLPSPAHHFTLDDANYYMFGSKIKKRRLHKLPFWKRKIRLAFNNTFRER